MRTVADILNEKKDEHAKYKEQFQRELNKFNCEISSEEGCSINTLVKFAKVGIQTVNTFECEGKQLQELNRIIEVITSTGLCIMMLNSKCDGIKGNKRKGNRTYDYNSLKPHVSSDDLLCYIAKRWEIETKLLDVATLKRNEYNHNEKKGA